MMRSKHVFFGVVAIVVVALAFAASVLNGFTSSCDVVTGIANDERRLNYLREWMSAALSKESFLELIGRDGILRLLDHPEKAESVGIEWNYLGIPPRNGFVEVNRLLDDRMNYLDPDSIKSVTVGYGRSGILINNNGPPYGVEWRGEGYVKALTPVVDGVFVVCL